MSQPSITLKTIMEMINARPTTPELEFALVEFLDLSDAEQKVLIFKEIVNLSSQMSWIAARLKP